MIAAGRPASVPSASPLRVVTGCGQLMPCPCQMRHQAEEERQIVQCDALFIQREKEISGRRVQQEIGILDAFGDALVGQQFADVVTLKEIRKLFGGDVGIHRHGTYAASGRSERGSGKNSFSSAAETVSTCSS